jgi:hypothetical protein
MSGAIYPLPQYAFMARCLVKKHRDNFTFYSCFKEKTMRDRDNEERRNKNESW